MTEAQRRLLARTDWGFVHQNSADGLRMEVSAGANVGERLMALGARHYGNIRAEASDWLERLEISQARIDDQLARLVASTSALPQLPTLSQQHLEALRTLAAQMERQNVLGEQLAHAMARLPGMLESVEHALARAAAADERTSAVVRDFQGTLDRVQDAMGRMVAHGEQHVLAAQGLVARRDQEFMDLTEGIQVTQLRAADELHRAAADGMQSLRQSHEDQSNRLQRIVQESAAGNRAVLFGLAMLAILTIGVLALRLIA
jgi:chromosome segregation ATPase